MNRNNSPSERRSLLTSEIVRLQLDAALISSPKHIFYFTGFTPGAPNLTSLLLVHKDGHSVLFTGVTEAEGAGKVFNQELISFDDYKLGERMIAYPDFIVEQFLEVLRRKNVDWRIARLGIEDWHLPQSYSSAISHALSGSAPVGLSRLILSMRRIKGSDEIARIREAVHRTDLAHKVGREIVKPGVTEIEIYDEISSALSSRYGVPIAFVGAYQSGKKRSVDPFGRQGPVMPTKRKLRLGDTVILDLSTPVDNYRSDVTRTLFVGRQNEKQKRMFKSLLNVIQNAEQRLKPGVTGGEIYHAISKEIAASGFANSLVHHAGHSIGLDGQEPPFFIPSSNEPLEEGMVCALEPGIYNSQVGGMRLENDYIITKEGSERIPKAPMEPW